jgi:hypothetical protein
MSRPTTQFEAFLYDRRVHVVAACLGALVLVLSVGLLSAAKSPSHFKALAAHLPEQPLNIQILRALPEPVEMKASAARLVSAPGRAIKPSPGARSPAFARR